MDLHLNRRDFQVVATFAVIDLGLTVYGISTGLGTELSPFFRPFTQRLPWMIGGALFYLAVLEVFNLLLAGELRNVLAAVGAGMHLMGMSTWVLAIVSPELAGNMSVRYMLFIWTSVATAGSYAVFERRGWRY
ncbi:MAG: hypothetical protein SV186_00145 [Candidatus Nanohaloarchaea archaeon]|nr:hypothetical protein [Candidatus Nanohaloarchaea archaeon]